MTTTTALRIRAEGRPAPKGSRNVKTTRAGKTYTYAASRFEKPWVDAVKAATELVMRHHDPLPPPYVLDLQILIERSSKPTHEWPSKHDLDKLARAVVDGLVAGKAISDDRHVTELHTTKRFADDGEPPGVIAYVTTI